MQLTKLFVNVINILTSIGSILELVYVSNNSENEIYAAFYWSLFLYSTFLHWYGWRIKGIKL